MAFTLTLDVLESGQYGNKFNGATDEDGIVTGTFIGGATDLQLSLKGYDIDFADEIEVFLNGVSKGNLEIGVNNGLSDHVIDIPLADQVAGENVVTFEVRNATWKWGITDLLLQEPGSTVTPPVVADITLTEGVLENGEFGNKYNGATDADGSFTAGFEGGEKDLQLSLKGYDIDYDDEIEVFLNGVSLGNLAIGVNNEFSDHVIDIPLADQIAGTNVVTFEVKNATWKWGVTDLLLQEPGSTVTPPVVADITLTEGVLESGEFGNNYNGATDADGSFTAGFEGGEKDLQLSLKGYDIDYDDEIEVFLNGVSLGNLEAGVNDDLSDHVIDIPLADQVAGTNVVTFEVKKPNWKWGVTDLELTDPNAPEPTFRTVTIDLRNDVRSDVPIEVASQGVVFLADAHHFATSVVPEPISGEIIEGAEIVWVAFNQSGSEAFIMFDYVDPIQNVKWDAGLGALNRATPYPDQDDGIDGWGSDEVVNLTFDFDVTFVEAELTPLVNPQNTQTDNQSWRMFTDTNDDGIVDTISPNLPNFEDAPQILGITDNVLGFGAQRAVDSFAITTVTLTVNEADLEAWIEADAFTVDGAAGVVALDVLRNDGAPMDLTNAITAVDEDLDDDGASDLLGTLTLAADGMSFEYDAGTAFDTLVVGQTATETFTYSMLGIDGVTYTETAVITIEGQSVSGAADDAFDVDGVAGDVTLDVIANDTVVSSISAVDTDLDGVGGSDILGTVSIAADALSLEYDAGTAFDDLYLGETATETFTYDALGADGATTTATVVVTVDGQRGSETAADAFDVDGVAGDVTLDVLANDGIIANITAVNGTTQGTVTLATDGQSVVYDAGTAFDTLAVGETATETFTYDAVGTDGVTHTETVEVTVQGQLSTSQTLTFDLISPTFSSTSDDLVFTQGGVTMTVSSELFFADQSPSPSSPIFVALNEFGSNAVGTGIFQFDQDATLTENQQIAGEGLGVYGPPLEVDPAVDGWGDDEVMIFEFSEDVKIIEVVLAPDPNPQNGSITNQQFRMFIDESGDGTLDAISANTDHTATGAVTDFAAIFDDPAFQTFDDEGSVWGFGAQRTVDSFYIESITIETIA